MEGCLVRWDIRGKDSSAVFPTHTHSLPQGHHWHLAWLHLPQSWESSARKKRYDGKLKSKLSKQDIWLCPQGLPGGDWDNDARKEQNGFLQTIRERVSSIPFFLGLSSCIQQAITKCWLSTIVLDALMDSTKSLVLCSVGIAEKTS